MKFFITVPGAVTPGPDVGTECPSGFTGTKPSCFKIDTTERSFINALKMCGDDAILAPIENGL